MRLHVGIFCTEQFLCAFNGRLLQLHPRAHSRHISFAGISLCIFVGRATAVASHYLIADRKVFTGDQLDALPVWRCNSFWMMSNMAVSRCMVQILYGKNKVFSPDWETRPDIKSICRRGMKPCFWRLSVDCMNEQLTNRKGRQVTIHTIPGGLIKTCFQG